MGGIIKLVSKIDRGRFKTLKQVSDEIGRDPSRIRQAIRAGKVEGPNHKMLLGDGSNPYSFVWLYTATDIRRLKKYFESLGPGRPPKDEES